MAAHTYTYRVFEECNLLTNNFKLYIIVTSADIIIFMELMERIFKNPVEYRFLFVYNFFTGKFFFIICFDDIDVIFFYYNNSPK